LSKYGRLIFISEIRVEISKSSLSLMTKLEPIFVNEGDKSLDSSEIWINHELKES
jgi:hypothetical protein